MGGWQTRSGVFDPGVLPGDGDVLIVASEADVGAVAIGELEGLVLADGKCDGRSDAGVFLFGERVLRAVQDGGAAEPEIAIGRGPQAGPEVVTKVRL